MDVIESFVNHYIREIDFYEKAAKSCAEICETELNKAGIRAIVTFRVKRLDRLKEKLKKRKYRKKYQCIDDIYADIVDLAGVRIALYFPSDKEQIDRFIKTLFNVKAVKRFPNARDIKAEKDPASVKYQKLFSGYHATHYRVNLKEGTQEEAKYAHANIEIQVASVLMHAWSEVEHDLIYKPMNGGLSLAEYEILDELNGLILAGELGLKRLHTAVKERVTHKEESFTNHFELAAFIYERISSLHPNLNMEDVVMGRADLMYKFLKSAKMNNPYFIDKHLNDLGLQLENISVVEQLIDKILEEDASLYKSFIKVKSEINRNPYLNSDEDDLGLQNRKSLFYFVDNLADLQYVVQKYAEKHLPNLNKPYLFNMDNLQGLFGGQHFTQIIDSIKDINNDLIHNSGEPNDESLINTGKMIEEIIEELLKRFDLEEKDEIIAKINEVKINV